MQNKLAKILSLCIILTLVFSFAACSNKKDDVKDETKNSSAENLEPAKTEEAKSDAVLTSDAPAAPQPEAPAASIDNQKATTGVPDAKDNPKEETPAPSQPASGQNSQAQDTPGKYADAEIYEKEGKKYAKTEDGTEVEMSGDNLQKMMKDYSKVQGSGSAEEKEILDKMQVILDNADKLSQK